GGHGARGGESRILRRAPRGDDQPGAGAGDRARGRPRTLGRTAARPSGARPVVGDRLGRPPGGPGDAALVGQSGRVSRPGVDLPLTAHALILVLVLIAPAARQAGPVGRFLGDWYPMLLLGGLYAEVGVLNVDLAYQHDLAVQRLELWAFGSQLSYRWIREMPNPLLSWYLHGCYLAYYAILYSSPLGLWLSGRRAAARHTIFAVMITFYLCYVVFLFFPV